MRARLRISTRSSSSCPVRTELSRPRRCGILRLVKITEPQMFRVVLIVGVAMVPVILLAAIVDPIAGAILFGIEVGVAVGYLVQRVRSAEPRAAEVAPLPGDGVHRVLVVAN